MLASESRSLGAMAGIRVLLLWAWAVATIAAFIASPAPAQEEPAAAEPVVDKNAKRVGRWLRISAPTTDRVQQQLQRIVDTTIKQSKQRGEWPVFILEIQPGRNEFPEALGLARFLSSPALNGATTVAYIPQSIDGHSVLIAMACDEIVMADDATIGKAGEYESSIDPSLRAAYAEIAGRRKTIPRAIALGMLDPALEVHVVETDVSREFALADELGELRERQAFQSSKVLIPAGRPGLFTGAEARDLGFVSYLASDPQAVAKALGLPRDAIEQDPSISGEWRPVLVEVRGVVTAPKAQQIQSVIQTNIREQGVNFVCVSIDSAGGDAQASINLASFLASLDPAEVRTVAYIEDEARGDAAFIALGCDNIVMRSDAFIGGAGAQQPTDKDMPLLVDALEDVAARKYRSTAIAAALVDPKVVVYQYTRNDGLVDYFTKEQAEELEDADQWRQGKQITTRGQPLRINGEVAAEIGLARAAVKNFSELKALYGLEGDPRLAEPSWAHYLIDALNAPGVRWALLFLGIVALYFEFQTPGLGLGGVIAFVCFLLYFWSAHLGGTAGWLEVLLFIAGIIFLAIEIFVLPGFGVFGLFGGLMIIFSLVLASQTFVIPHNTYQLAQLRNSLFALTAIGVGTIIVAYFARSLLPRAPMFNRMLLQPPSGEELSELSQREAVADFSYLIGEIGQTTTLLVPGGKAQFGDKYVDVIANGEYIDRGETVRVVEVHGNRVIVERVV